MSGVKSTFIDIAWDSVVPGANDDSWHVTVFVATLEAETRAGIQMPVVFKSWSSESLGWSLLRIGVVSDHS